MWYDLSRLQAIPGEWRRDEGGARQQFYTGTPHPKSANCGEGGACGPVDGPPARRVTQFARTSRGAVYNEGIGDPPPSRSLHKLGSPGPFTEKFTVEDRRLSTIEPPNNTSAYGDISVKSRMYGWPVEAPAVLCVPSSPNASQGERKVRSFARTLPLDL